MDSFDIFATKFWKKNRDFVCAIINTTTLSGDIFPLFLMANNIFFTMSIMWQIVRRITHKILGVKGLRLYCHTPNPVIMVRNGHEKMH